MPQSSTAAVESPKRAAILAQAVEVFAQQGYRHADVQEIADRAQVGKGTVYRNFASKEDLFDAATYDVLLRLERHMFGAVDLTEDPLQVLYRIGTAHTAFFDQHPSYLEIFVQNRAEFRGTVPPLHKELHEQMIGRLVEVVQRGIDGGQLAEGDPRSIVMALGTVLYGTIMFGCYVKDDYRLTALGEVSLRSFLRGIQGESESSQF